MAADKVLFGLLNDDVGDVDFVHLLGNGGNFTSDAWWKNAMTNAYVITRDQLPDLK